MTAHIQKTKPKIYPLGGVLLAIISILSTLDANGEISPAKADSLIAQADKDFAQKAYPTAATAYLELFENGWFSPSALLHYAWIKENSGQPEETVYALYKYFLLTDDQDAYTKVVELTDKYSIPGYQRSEQEYLADQFQKYLGLFVSLMATLVTLLLSYLIYKKRQQPKYRPFTIGFGILAVLALMFISINTITPAEKAIISQPGALLMNGPSAASGVHTPARSGQLVSILQKKDVWVQIKVAEKMLWVKEWELRKL